MLMVYLIEVMRNFIGYIRDHKTRIGRIKSVVVKHGCKSEIKDNEGK
ncbi:MAG: hypothetical protein N3E39_00090 [Candidatus Methanomethylicia archaeon]|nr:hypothetical protein [Candidatus Methanomethylicia archaeon]